jgi:hypothetical protein
MSDQTVEPNFQSTRFTCPGCNKLTEHAWFNTYANQIFNAEGYPLRIAGEGLKMLANNPQFPPEVREQKVAYWNRVNSGEVFLDRWAPVQTDLFVAGLELSVCHECLQAAVWLGGKMFYPLQD